MRSLRIWITVTMLWIIVAALATVTLLSAFFINKTKSSEADQLLWMLCDTEAKSLDYYFNSIENNFFFFFVYGCSLNERLKCVWPNKTLDG